jgi:hypothetical protein
VDRREKDLRWQRDPANGVVIVEVPNEMAGYEAACGTFGSGTNLLAVMQRRSSRASSAARASIKVAIDPARCVVCERSLDDAGGQGVSR